MGPKGRFFVAARIQRVVQLETSVQGCTLSPWNGLTVYGLLIQQPAPLCKTISAPMLTAESIRVHPEWRALLDRRLAIRGIEIRKPDLALAIELLSQIPSAPVEPSVVAKQPDLAVIDPPTGETPIAPNLLPTPPQINIPQPEATTATIPQKSPDLVVNDSTVWVTLSDARLRIVSEMSKMPLFRITSINGKLPVSGKSAVSELILDGISVWKTGITSPVKVPVKWQAPLLSLGVVDTSFQGIDCKLEAMIELTRGIPFLIGGLVPKQEGREIELPEMLRAKLGSIAAQGHFQGYALAPRSWQGQGVIQALAIDTEFVDAHSFFHYGQSLVIFEQGVLKSPDTRLIGDDVGILGNGMVLSDGRFAGHLRIVATPENLVAISRRTQTDSSLPQLTPLSTPQRAALDMQAFGLPGKAYFQANPAAKPVLIR